MATLNSIVSAVSTVLQDPDYTEPILIEKANEAVLAIAGGVRMPDGHVSPPLQELYSLGTVTTSTVYPYVSLPTDYQRQVFMIADNLDNPINPIDGGDYYAFQLFLSRCVAKDLTQSGSIINVAIKGRKLYYQGIPTAATTLTVHYYRKPVDMSALTDEPDGLPDHLAMRLIKNWVCKEELGEGIEDGEDSQGRGYQYHTTRFYEAMTDLIDYVGIDAVPQYYASRNGRYMDLGACD